MHRRGNTLLRYREGKYPHEIDVISRNGLNLYQLKVIQDHRPWCQSKAHICNLFLVILVVSRTVFEISTHKARK